MKRTTIIVLSFLMVSFGFMSCDIEQKKPLPESIATKTTINNNTEKAQEIEGIVLETDEIPGDQYKHYGLSTCSSLSWIKVSYFCMFCCEMLLLLSML